MSGEWEYSGRIREYREEVRGCIENRSGRKNSKSITSTLTWKRMMMQSFFVCTGNRCDPHQLSEARRMAKQRSKGTTTKRLNVTLFEKKSALSARWILLEKEKRWKNNKGGSHEVEGYFFNIIHSIYFISNHFGFLFFTFLIFLFIYFFFFILNCIHLC